jgi:hypothetical protein
MKIVGFVFLKVFCIISLVSILFSNSSSVLANFDVTPYNADKNSITEKNWFIINGSAGGKFTESFRISNNSKENIDFELNAKDALILEDGSFSLISDQDANQNVGNWLKVDINKLNVQSNQFVEVPLYVDIPLDVKDGEYAAGVAVSQINQNKSINLQTVIRKGVRTYIAVGSDFNLEVAAANLNILDPKDVNFEDIKNKKPYFGSDNMLLEFEAENTGNVFGILETKYAIKYENGEVFENTFSTEIAPNVGKRKYYIITNQSYQIGTTEAILDYKIKPLNIEPSKVKIENSKAVLSDSLNLTQNELNNFSPAKTKAFIKPGESISSETKNNESKDNMPNWLKVVLIVVGILVALTGVGAWYFFYRKKKSKTN